MAEPAPDDGILYSVTPEQGKVVGLLMLIPSTISLFTTIFGTLLFFYIRYQFPRLADRVTFRLALGTMLSDMGISASILVISLWAFPGPICTYSMWGVVFFSLMSIFLPTCIAINLQVMFLYEYRGRRKFEKFYFLGAFALALILSSTPFADNMYGWDEPEGACFFRDSGTKLSITWQWGAFYTWEILGILVCTVTIICVAVKLYKVSNQSINTNISGQTMTSRYEKNVLRNKAIISLVVKRVVWYPIVPIITQAPNFLVETDIYINQEINYVFLLLSTFASFQGLLNTIIFMQDLAVSRAYSLMKLRWWSEHVNKYEELYPHLSRNKAFGGSDHEVVKDEQQQEESQKQPSFVEKTRYGLLTLFFSRPKEDKQLVDYDQYMTTRDDEEMEMSSEPILDDGNNSDLNKGERTDDAVLDQFNKDVLCKL